VRLVKTFAAGLALAAPGTASAQTGAVATAPLSPGEVLLEVNAHGSVRSRADRALLVVSMSSAGVTDAEADRAVVSQLERLRGLAGRFGVQPQDIRVHSTPSTIMPVMAPPPPAPPAPPPPPRPAGDANSGAPRIATPVQIPRPRVSPRHGAWRNVEVVIRDPARAPALRAAIDESELGRLGAIQYSLEGDAAARRAARASAIASARAEAESYAATLNMRVARLVRVTERIGIDFLSAMMGDPTAMRRAQTGLSTDQEIETRVVLGVDFALAPQ
jgi:uncharacterized protein YggE